MILRIVAALFAIALEGWAGMLIFQPNEALRAVVLHLVACVLLALWGLRSIPRVNDLPGATTWLFGVMIPLPVVGPLFSFAILAVILLLPERLKTEDLIVVGLPDAGGIPTVEAGTKARSIIELLASGETMERREAILSLRTEISPSAVLILQKAVGDSDEQVRNYAQSQLAKWIEKSELRIKHLTEKANSSDAPPEVLLALAECLHWVVTIHLAGPELERKYLQLALGYLERIPLENSLKRNADLLAAHCFLRIREVKQARAVLERLETSGYVHESIAWLRWRTLFHERNWSGLREVLRNVNPEGNVEIAQLRRFWHAEEEIG